MPPNVRSSFIDIRRIEASKGCSQLQIMEHAQPTQSMNTKTRENGLLTSVLNDTRKVPSAGCILPTDEGLKSHLHYQGIVKVVLMLVDVLFLKFLYRR